MLETSKKICAGLGKEKVKFELLYHFVSHTIHYQATYCFSPYFTLHILANGFNSPGAKENYF